MATVATSAGEVKHPNQTDSTASAMTEAKGSPFLNLPRELRDAIYSIVFQGCTTKLDASKHKATPDSLGLLIACKQTYTETIDVYYRNVTLHWRYVRTFPKWAQHLPRTFFQQIRNIQVNVWVRQDSYLRGSESILSEVAKIWLVISTNGLRYHGVKLDEKLFTVVFTEYPGMEV